MDHAEQGAPAAELSVGCFNIRNLGWRKGEGHCHLGDAIEFILGQTPKPPDILALPEATKILEDAQTVLRRQLVYPLSQALSHGWYEPVFASQGVPGRSNHHHLLLVNTNVVKPLEWYDPSYRSTSDHQSGFLRAEIFGHEVWLCCEHWPGGQGREAFNAAANRISQHGGDTAKTLLLGDFNATSSWVREHRADWEEECRARGEMNKVEQKGWYNPEAGRWEIDTRQIDKLRQVFGYVDMGEELDDPAPTTHPQDSQLRIDRIFRSTGFPGRATQYTAVLPPYWLSDHAYVFGCYELPALAASRHPRSFSLVEA